MSVVPPEGLTGLPFAQASPFLRSQAMATAHHILGAAYPFVVEAQWHQAFDDLQLPLFRFGDGPASLSTDGLAALVQYLETRYRATAAAAPTAAVAPPPAVAAVPPTKQTYSIHPDLVTRLERVSYWCRQTRSRVVNQALSQLLDQYPEASVPVPPA
jgi:hypothetical protein